jgi:hypothetical protein
MSDRSLIFNAKGTQIGYIEGDLAFDLTGRERCNKEPKDVSPRTVTAPQPENLVEHSPLVSKSREDPETALNTSKTVVDEVPIPQDELTVPDPSKSSSTENELVGLAIGMIRSALEKGSE